MMKKIIILPILLIIGMGGFAQVSGVGNNFVAGRYVGWDASNTVNPLFFRTNNLNRMKINGNVTYGINGYPTASYNGYMLLGINNNSMSGGANMGNTFGINATGMNVDYARRQSLLHREWCLHI